MGLLFSLIFLNVKAIVGTSSQEARKINVTWKHFNIQQFHFFLQKLIVSAKDESYQIIKTSNVFIEMTIVYIPMKLEKTGL